MRNLTYCYVCNRCLFSLSVECEDNLRNNRLQDWYHLKDATVSEFKVRKWVILQFTNFGSWAGVTFTTQCRRVQIRTKQLSTVALILLYQVAVIQLYRKYGFKVATHNANESGRLIKRFNAGAIVADVTLLKLNISSTETPWKFETSTT